MLHFFALLCLVAGTLATPKAEVLPRLDDGRIFGGCSTTINSYSYQVSVQYGGSHICGGSIISSNVVLTAAHCLVYSSAGYTVRAGTTTRNSGGTVYSVSSVTRHSSFSSSTYAYNIGVIRISSSFSLGNTMKVVTLPAVNEAVTTGAAAFVTGWGATSNDGSGGSTLQVIMLPILSNAQCAQIYGVGAISSQGICAGYTEGGCDKGPCQGDDGGPLVVSSKQVGIVSYINSCAGFGYPHIYTRVAAFRSWISSNAGI